MIFSPLFRCCSFNPKFPASPAHKSMRISNNFIALLLLLLAPLFSSSNTHAFDVRKHLATVTRYDFVRDVNNNAYVTSKIPDGCHAIHLNLVARHGTRSPTKKRIKELDQLAIHLESILSGAKHGALGDNVSLLKVPKWLWGWQSPWKGKGKGGELVKKGEKELYNLGIRVRERFSDLFNHEYHPDVFSIRATQVPRASASAIAFGLGLFSGKGDLGPGKHRAFAVTSESRASDINLRFFDSCTTYKEFRESQEPAVEKLKEPILDEISSAFVMRYQLNFSRQDVASFWFLCKQEASLLDVTDQACALFRPSEVELLEWTDDLEGFLLKGYGKSVNYLMGVPLLKDVFLSMEQAILAKEEQHQPGTFEKARLRFAHAETIVPFTCLLGLFLKGSEFEQMQREEPLDLPPKPPKERSWRGNILAPFAGNDMLVLYKCSVNDSRIVSPAENRSMYFVQVLHNEAPIPMPGCGYTDFCPYDVFKEKIINPHLKLDYNLLCNSEAETLKSESQKPHSTTWLYRMLMLLSPILVLYFYVGLSKLYQSGLLSARGKYQNRWATSAVIW